MDMQIAMQIAETGTAEELDLIIDIQSIAQFASDIAANKNATAEQLTKLFNRGPINRVVDRNLSNNKNCPIHISCAAIVRYYKYEDCE